MIKYQIHFELDQSQTWHTRFSISTFNLDSYYMGGFNLKGESTTHDEKQ